MSDQQSSSIRVTAWGAADALGEPFDSLSLLDRDEAVLTTDHARSSRGLPVVIRNGRAFGPADLPGTVLHWSTTESAVAASMIAPARAAGWSISIAASCDWCAESLSDPETRAPGDTHPVCAETRDRIRAQMAAPGYVPIPITEYRAR